MREQCVEMLKDGTLTVKSVVLDSIIKNNTFVPKITRVIFNNEATTAFFCDNTKVTVMCNDCDNYDRHTAVLYCILKRICGTILPNGSVSSPGYMRKLNAIVKSGYDQAAEQNRKEIQYQLKRENEYLNSISKRAEEDEEEGETDDTASCGDCDCPKCSGDSDCGELKENTSNETDKREDVEADKTDDIDSEDCDADDKDISRGHEKESREEGLDSALDDLIRLSMTFSNALNKTIKGLKL